MKISKTTHYNGDGILTYISSIPPEEATGLLRELYDQDLAGSGSIVNYTRAMSLRPEAIAAWRNLSKAIKSNMSLRLYELVTLAAASALRCSY